MDVLDRMPDKKRQTRKASKQAITVWNKNPALERFWGDLASQKQVVVIYKDGTHKYIKLPKRFTEKYKAAFNGFDTDPTIVDVLYSYPSQDAYEQSLYPKAKDKTVEYVIAHYKKYFKPIGPVPKDVIASGAPLMKKVRVP